MLGKVAFHSAKKFTSLEPVLVTDCKDHPLAQWVLGEGYEVWEHSTSFLPALERVCESSQNPGHLPDRVLLPDAPASKSKLPVAAGCFLRCDAPNFCQEHHVRDQFVLVTDLDVMFLSDPVPELSKIRPQFLAGVGENDPTKTDLLNTGVLLMNVENMRADFQGFSSFVHENMNRLFDGLLEQRAYQEYYVNRIELLPPGMNWRPYWNPQGDTPIIHLHGPKPFDRDALYRGKLPALSHLNGGQFELIAERWFDLLAEVSQDSPRLSRDASLYRLGLVHAQANHGRFKDADMELFESFKRRGRRIDSLQAKVENLLERLRRKDEEIERLRVSRNPFRRAFHWMRRKTP